MLTLLSESSGRTLTPQFELAVSALAGVGNLTVESLRVSESFVEIDLGSSRSDALTHVVTPRKAPEAMLRDIAQTLGIPQKTYLPRIKEYGYFM
jgi:hypothetical protein